MSHRSSVSRLRLTATFLAASGALSAALVGCGATDALVGGECGPGFAQCDFQCVDLSNDPDNCGSCGTVCSPGTSCVASECVAPRRDGSDAGVAPDAGDGAIGNGSTSSGTPSDDAGEDARANGGDGSQGSSPDGGTVQPVDGGSSSDAMGDAGAGDAGNADASAGDAGNADASAGDAGNADASAGDAGTGNDGGSSSDAGDGGGQADDASQTADSGAGDGSAPVDPGADAGGDDGSAPVDPGADAGTDDGSTCLDASPADGQASECVPPFDTAAQCGDCFTVCSGVNDTCASGADGGFACVPLCNAPLTECNAQCVDEQTDPNNCGTCGKVCPSGLCGIGLCEGATPGDDIVIGHDYSSTLPFTAQARALSNAVLLPSSNPVRVLSFEEYASPASVIRVKAILAAAASAEGKSIAFTVSMDDTDVPRSLGIAAFDTLLVFDQAGATAGTLGSIGSSWAPTLTTFLLAGGDVVTLDGAAGPVAEMPFFESNAHLLSVTSHTPIAPGTSLSVVAPGDSVALGVLNPYGATTRSAHFATTEAVGKNAAYVVIDPASGEPVVVHKTIE